MDPNETLRLMRDALTRAATIRAAIGAVEDDGAGVADPDDWAAYDDARGEAADYADALDGWLSGGGFLPDAWQARTTGTPAELAALVTTPTDQLYGPTTGQQRCVHCGRLIRLTHSGWTWVDADDPSGSLVFCTDQDETHDGIRHAPNGGGIAAPVPSEPDRCGATDTNGPQLIVPTTWYCNLPAGHDGAHAARRGNALPNGERVTLHSWPA